MTQMVVNERSPVRPRRALRFILISAAVLVALLALGWFLLLPWLLRHQVHSALRSVGVRDVTFDVARATPWGSVLTNIEAGDGSAIGVEEMALDYSPLDLWRGRLHGIRLRGGRLELGVHEGRIDLSPLAAFVFAPDRPTTRPGDESAALPVSVISLRNSQLVIRTEQRTLEIPVDVAVQNLSPQRLLIAAHVGPEKSLLLNGEVNLAAGSAAFNGVAQAGWSLLTIRSIWPQADVGIAGEVALSGDADWSGAAPAARLRVVVADAPPDVPANAPAAQLRVSAGVFDLAGEFGAQPRVRVSAQGAAIELADEGFAADGVTGAITFTGVSPLTTPEAQQLSAASMKIGEMTFADGTVRFQVRGDLVQVEHTQWQALGGTIWAEEFRIGGDGPMRVTVHVQDVELRDVLEAYGQGKVAGTGRLSGELPVIVDEGQLEFGDGRLVSRQGGQVRIKDVEMLDSVADAAAPQGSPEQVRRNVAEALRDFEYDRLGARLENEPANGLVAYLSMSGRGRTGARQEIRYDARIRGLDDLLRSYLAIQQAMERQSSTRKAEEP